MVGVPVITAAAEVRETAPGVPAVVVIVPVVMPLPTIVTLPALPAGEPDVVVILPRLTEPVATTSTFPAGKLPVVLVFIFTLDKLIFAGVEFTEIALYKLVDGAVGLEVPVKLNPANKFNCPPTLLVVDRSIVLAPPVLTILPVARIVSVCPLNTSEGTFFKSRLPVAAIVPAPGAPKMSGFPII